MNQTQRNAAKKAMVDWLKHPAELGKAPAKIECAGEFDLYDMHYYIFKYKKGIFGKWMLGVAGGYEGDELENCGHTFSEMQLYQEATAEKDAIALVEYVRNYIMEQANRAEEKKQNTGTFVNFVLLKDAVWNKEAFLNNLKEGWGIEPEPQEDEEKEEESDEILVFSYQGAMISVALMPGPIPDGEAEYHAGSNYRWKEAVETVKKHKAQLVVAVLGSKINKLDAAQMLVKVVDTCCKADNVLGVYANETVYQPEFYIDCARMMKDDMFPILNLVWAGLYGGEKGLCAYTCGMNELGYDELEILNTKEAPGDVIGVLLDTCTYVVTNDVTLKDGETIGFTPEQKLPITKSKGVAVEGESLKIGY
ncbi:MAG: DUF4261 domain-containing protein [Lachnospiraceae bacterium]|nr:DUF4261 domain-containing protein [Lachnospiraceae bacterium]